MHVFRRKSVSWSSDLPEYSVARDAGHEVSVYQQDIYHWPDSHLTQYLAGHAFDVVEVSVIGGYYQYRKRLSLSAAISADCGSRADMQGSVLQ